MRPTLIAIRFHAGFVLDLRSVCSTVQVSLHRTDLQIVNGGKERLNEKNRAVAICYLPFSTFGSNYSAAMRFDSTRSGALSSGSVQFYGASNRASICCRGDYLSAYFFGPRDPADTSNDWLDHISPTKEKNRTRLLPRSIDRSRDRLLCFSNSLPRSAASVNRDLVGSKVHDLDLGPDSIAYLPKFPQL